jgi:hypothetical protein
VVGVALGASLGLALLTFLATYFFMRHLRRQSELGSRHSSRREQRSVRMQSKASKQMSSLETSPSTDANNAWSLDNYLPSPADDNTVRMKVSTLLDQVRLHVDNFYENSVVSITEDMKLELSRFSSLYLPFQLEPLLQTSRQTRVIKYCLSWLIVCSMSPEGDPERSLLPIEFVALPNAINKARSKHTPKLGMFHGHCPQSFQFFSSIRH